MLKILIGCAILFSNVLQAIELTGSLTQGGLVSGKLPNASQVRFNDTLLKLSENGDFVFGFSRDDKLQHTLSWHDKKGVEHQQKFIITKRHYNIDKINGVANKYVSPPDTVLKRIKKEAKLVKNARNTVSNRVDFLQPVYQPAEGRISGVYGSQRFFNGTPKRPHYGLDIANKTGTKVFAPLPGKVILAENNLYYSGGTLILDHGQGITSTYIHLSKILIDNGQVVNTGDPIAEIGATGRVTGPHLDWRLNWQQVRLDPALVMKPELASTLTK